MITRGMGVCRGPRFVVTEAATALPAGKPQADDTKEMVEHFERLGLIQRVPAAFMVGGNVVIHPVLAAQLKTTGGTWLTSRTA